MLKKIENKKMILFAACVMFTVLLGSCLGMIFLKKDYYAGSYSTTVATTQKETTTSSFVISEKEYKYYLSEENKYAVKFKKYYYDLLDINVKYNKNEITKEKWVDEINKLSKKVANTINECNSITDEYNKKISKGDK